MRDSRYLKLVSGFGLYHMVAIAAFMLPVVSDRVWMLLGTIHQTLQLSGAWPSASSGQTMFVNLFACLAFLWGLLRFRHPSRLLGIYEGWGMLLFSGIVIYHVINGASLLWLIIPLVDLPGGLLHLYLQRNI